MSTVGSDRVVGHASDEQMAAGHQQAEKLRKEVSAVIEHIACDGVIPAGSFVDMCQLLDQSSYRDAVEERAIASVCGYGLCTSPLSKIPSQQFVIRQNRVFDISDRKFFCSDRCFTCSMHVFEQLPDEPLWITGPRAAFKISLLPKETTKGLPGKEVPLSLPADVIQRLQECRISEDSHGANVVTSSFPEEISAVSNKAPSELSDAASTSSRHEYLGDDSDHEYTFDPLADELVPSRPQRPKLAAMETTSSSVASTKQHALEDIRNRYFTRGKSGLVVRKPEKVAVLIAAQPLPKLVASSDVKKLPPDVTINKPGQAEGTAEKSRHWLSAKAKFISWLTPSTHAFIADSKAEQPASESSNDSTKFESLPDAQKRAYAFLYGESESSDSASQSRSEEIVLPCVDSIDQDAKRRALLLQQLGHAWPLLLPPLKLIYGSIQSDLHRLVLTLKLTRDNVVLSPKECRILALLVLLLLSERRTAAYRESVTESSITESAEAYAKSCGVQLSDCFQLVDTCLCATESETDRA